MLLRDVDGSEQNSSATQKNFHTKRRKGCVQSQTPKSHQSALRGDRFVDSENDYDKSAGQRKDVRVRDAFVA